MTERPSPSPQQQQYASCCLLQANAEAKRWTTDQTRPDQTDQTSGGQTSCSVQHPVTQAARQASQQQCTIVQALKWTDLRLFLRSCLLATGGQPLKSCPFHSICMNIHDVNFKIINTDLSNTNNNIIRCLLVANGRAPTSLPSLLLSNSKILSTSF